jgi:hypothetical protein
MKWLVLFIIPNIAFAQCDFTSILPTNHNTFEYTEGCHREVGLMKVKLEKLNKVIELKDLALDKANERAELWMNTSIQMQDKFMKVEKLNRENGWIYFGAGMLTMLGAAYVLSVSTHH